MVAELEILSEWIPEQMQPGTIFVLENAGHIGEKEDPYWAVLFCPNCGTLGLITRKQIAGLIAGICGSHSCSAQFFIRDSEIQIRKPFESGRGRGDELSRNSHGLATNPNQSSLSSTLPAPVRRS